MVAPAPGQRGEIVKRPLSSVAWSVAPLLALALMIALASGLK
jgi:hypothetical protein